MVSVQKEEFLINTRNKTSFIRVLTLHLRSAGVEVMQVDADADVVIVEAALQHDRPGRPVTVTPTDTDTVGMSMARAENHSNIVGVHPRHGNTLQKAFSSPR